MDGGGILEDLPLRGQDIEETVRASCHLSNVSVLYGGSVDAANIKDYLCYTEIRGALVGGASLRVDQIKKIVAGAIKNN